MQLQVQSIRYCLDYKLESKCAKTILHRTAQIANALTCTKPCFGISIELQILHNYDKKKSSPPVLTPQLFHVT